MADADLLLRQGDLEGARAELVARARAAPADAPTRMFLFQLLALAGEWDKARAQLDTLAKLSPEAQMLAVAYGQAIGAERARAAALAGAGPVPVLARGGDWIDDLAAALGHAATDRADQAAEARARALDAAPDTPGRWTGADGIAVPFDWIADADQQFGPALEAVVGGRWGLLPFDAVERIESKGVRDLRDTVWYPAEIRLRAGGSVAALLPVRYPGSEASADMPVRLGRATTWDEAGAGLGQHLLMLSGGEEHGLLALRRLDFEAA